MFLWMKYQRFFCSHLQNVRLILLLGVMILCFLLLERGNSYEKKRCSTFAMYLLYSTLYLMKVVSASLFLKIVYQYKVSVILLDVYFTMC